MNLSKIISLFENTSLLKEVEINELHEVIEVYPFFNHARLLLTKKMQQSQHLLLKKEIKRTAVSVSNRQNLYEFLYQKEIQNSIIETENQTNLTPEEINTNTEEPSSFEQPVIIPPSVKPESSFKKPIDLKNFGEKESKSIDALEQQIIGQTIEHVLSLEIESSKAIITKPITPKTPDTNNDNQKFSDWLNTLDHDRLNNRKEKNKNTEDNNSPTESSIIDSFLQKDINVITPINNNIEHTPSNLARLSIVDDEEFVTETLAKIYLAQGNFSKALSAYNKLLLKYPKKKTYFAAQIENIEQDLK